MAFQIPDSLDRALYPLAWLVGRWEGTGHSTWPGEPDQSYEIQMQFIAPGGPSLYYLSETFTADDQGRFVVPRRMETGFWRPQADGTIDVVMCAPQGWAEVWTGKVDTARLELVTDAVARTATADLPYTGGHRLYGLVDSHLMWAYDRATTDVPLREYEWARLARV